MNRTIQQPQPPTIAISTTFSTKREPFKLITEDIEYFSLEIAKRIKEAIISDSNAVSIEVKTKNGVHNVTLTVHLCTNSILPEIRSR